MADVTFKRIDEMETLYHGVARRARAELGVTAWGMQVYELPPNWDGHPNHAHDDGTEEAGQEEVYIPLAGSATLIADDETLRAATRHDGARRTHPAPADPARPGRHPVRRDRRAGRRPPAVAVDGARRPVADAARSLTRLLVAARNGDEQAFVQLTSPHRRALHVHAYRMLGNLHDADDALQETLLRAWRGLPGYEPRAALTTWLHRIATNVALRMLEQRKPVEPLDAHLQPYPDRFLDELPTPEEQTIARERLGLAYVAAMQLLPARQRAVLALREGLGWSARETGEALELSTAAVNSALQRARERLARDPEALARIHDSSAEAAVVDAFLQRLGRRRHPAHHRPALRRRAAHDAADGPALRGRSRRSASSSPPSRWTAASTGSRTRSRARTGSPRSPATPTTRPTA